MKKNSFLEYVDSKGKLKNPIISVDGDNLEVDKSPDKPEGGGNPYIAKSIKTNDKERIKGLGNSGNQDMIYQPAVDKSGKSKASDKAPAKIPTVNEISITSRYARTLSESPMLVENLVAQIKSKGMLGPLVAELLNHKETFNHISQIMAHESYGVNLCNKLVKALNEDVSQPFSDELGDEQPDDEQANGDENEEDFVVLGVEEVPLVLLAPVAAVEPLFPPKNPLFVFVELPIPVLAGAFVNEL